MYRNKSRLGVVGDFIAFVALTGFLSVVLIVFGLAGTTWMKQTFAPLTNKVCTTQLAPTATRVADLWGDWKSLGAQSWTSAFGDALRNEWATNCTGVTDMRREAFLNAADRMARAARAALGKVGPAGVRTEVDRIRIEQAQLAGLPLAQQEIARFSLASAEALLVQPDSNIVQNVADVSGVTATIDGAKNQVNQIKDALNASGLYNMLGTGDLLGQFEAQVSQKVTNNVLPTKLFLPHKVTLEPLPQLAIMSKVKHIDGILVGLPLTLITEGMTGGYSAQRLWMTMELEVLPNNKLSVKRWITRPL